VERYSLDANAGRLTDIYRELAYARPRPAIPRDALAATTPPHTASLAGGASTRPDLAS
jgi:hypothetical protein